MYLILGLRLKARLVNEVSRSAKLTMRLKEYRIDDYSQALH